MAGSLLPVKVSQLKRTRGDAEKLVRSSVRYTNHNRQSAQESLGIQSRACLQFGPQCGETTREASEGHL
jgi:hypothetical protein